MIALIAYFVATIVLLIFLVSITVYTSFLLYSSWMGSPYVPTRQKEMECILRKAQLKKRKMFVELGCGDGRVMRMAAKKYGVRGTGIDVNPIVLGWAKFLSRLQKVNNLTYIRQNMFNADLSQADYLYLFLMPDLINKLTPKLRRQIKKNCVIISHGFPVKSLEDRLINKIPHSPFPTYFYRI